MLPFDPKKPLFGFSAKFPHAKRRIHLFMDETGRCVFFRPKNAPTDWVGAFFDNSVGDHRKTALSVLLGNPFIEVDTRSAHFWRVLHLPDPREGEKRTWRVLWRPEIGYVYPLGHPKELNGAYFKPRASCLNVCKTSARALEKHFEQEWFDTKSDVRSALPWCDWTKEGRTLRAIKWEYENFEALVKVIESAFHTAPFWPEDPQYQKSLRVVWMDQMFFHFDFFQEETERFRNLFNPLLKRIEAICSSSYSLPAGDRSDWKLSWITSDWSTVRDASHWIEVNPPTSHERLEAALFLRDWLGQNAPDLLADWFPT